MDRLVTVKKWLTIDKRMLPIKLHFFFYSLATAAPMSYFPIIVKNIGISSTAMGIIFTISPFVTILADPLFGWIADKLQRVKLVIIALVLVQTPMFIGIVFMPPILTEKFFSVQLCCLNDSYAVYSPKLLTLNPNNTSLKCKANCQACLRSQSNHSVDEVKLCGENIIMDTEKVLNASDFVMVINITVHGEQYEANCLENESDKCVTVCAFKNANKESGYNEFSSYQFWCLLFLMLIALVSENGIIALGDAACYEALEGKLHRFGKQRIFLSIGWGLGNMIAGYLLDLTNPNSDEKVNFSYCAYILLILISFDIISLSRATLTRSGESKNILKDVGKVFVKVHSAVFAIAVFLIGAFSGLQWNFQFWYLEEMGASKFLLGLAIAILSLGVEGPFLFISGWVVRRIGRDNTMVLAFSAFAAWFLSASFIYNPWWILLIELTQGPSYGLFYAAMTSYGKLATAPGTEATMQAVLGALFHGVGVGSGSLFGGLGFDIYNGRTTFRFGGFLALGLAIVYKLFTVFVAGESSVIRKGDTKVTDTVETPKKGTSTKKEIPRQDVYFLT